MGRNGALKDWGYRWRVLAIRILFSTVKPEWLHAVCGYVDPRLRRVFRSASRSP